MVGTFLLGSLLGLFVQGEREQRERGEEGTTAERPRRQANVLYQGGGAQGKVRPRSPRSFVGHGGHPFAGSGALVSKVLSL